MSINTTPVLKVSYNAGDDGQRGFYLGATYGWAAQLFKPLENMTVTKVRVKLVREAGSTIGNCTLAICASSADKPSGPALGQSIVDCSAVATDPGEWVDFVLASPTPLTANVVYCIVMRGSNDDAAKPISWRKDGSSPAYTDGTMYASSAVPTPFPGNGNGTWSVLGEDGMFEVWGY